MKDIFTNIEQQIENIDAKIEDIVNNATTSNNYKELNQTINEMVNHSVGVFERGYEKAEKVVKEQSEKVKTAYELQQEKIKKRTVETKPPVSQQPQVKPNGAGSSPHIRAMFANKDGVYNGGLAMAIIGFIFVALLGLGILSMLILNLALPFIGIFLAVNRYVLWPLLIIFLLMALGGRHMMTRVNRYKKYILALGGKTYGPVSELAYSVNKSEVFVRNDLQKMINASWFKQGRLTHDREILMVHRDAYESYEAQRNHQFEMERIQEANRQVHEQLPSQARLVIQKGEDFMKEIHEKKVAISDYDMTLKLSELETTLKKIFKRVETHPEVVPQVRKMMDYYLPTTVKLLDAYVQLDKQTIDGANISAAKAEIQESLDTLAAAYEKLLDDLFQDVMLDVSTDIAVLNTMLTQDGLKANGFDNMTIAQTDMHAYAQELEHAQEFEQEEAAIQ